MKKTIIITFALLCLAAVSVKAQSPNQKVAVGIGMIYDWQFDKGSVTEFGKATNIGLALYMKGEINYAWDYRLNVAIPGLLKPVSSNDGNTYYDRYGYGGLDLLINVLSVVEGDRKASDLYALMGAGIGYGMGDTGLGIRLNIGLGYCYSYSKKGKVTVEYDIASCNNFTNLSGALVLGFLFCL